MIQKNPHSKWIEQIKVTICSQLSISKDIVVPDKLLLINESSVHFTILLRVTISSGSQRGGPWSPGALKFLLWSPEPAHFTGWSPEPFLAVEPGAQRNLARSPEPSILKFDHSTSQIALILDYCFFVCFCV